MLLVNGGSTAKTVNNENERMTRRLNRKELKVSSIININTVITKNRYKVVNSETKPITPRSANDVILGNSSNHIFNFNNVRYRRRKREVLSGKNETIIKEMLNGAILRRRRHVNSAMNIIMFDTKFRSSGNKNEFDIIFVEIKMRKSGLNGLVFASGDMRLINKYENIFFGRNDFREGRKLVAMKYIVAELRRETFFGLLSPFGRGVTSDNENIGERKRKRLGLKEELDSGEHRASFARLSGSDGKNSMNRTVFKLQGDVRAKRDLVVKNIGMKLGNRMRIKYPKFIFEKNRARNQFRKRDGIHDGVKYLKVNTESKILKSKI